MSKYVQISGSQFARDTETGAVVNINKDEIERARKAKKLRRQKESEFDTLKNEVGEIKELLNKLIEKL
jgi:hypothetical protein